MAEHRWSTREFIQPGVRESTQQGHKNGLLALLCREQGWERRRRAKQPPRRSERIQTGLSGQK